MKYLFRFRNEWYIPHEPTLINGGWVWDWDDIAQLLFDLRQELT